MASERIKLPEATTLACPDAKMGRAGFLHIGSSIFVCCCKREQWVALPVDKDERVKVTCSACSDAHWLLKTNAGWIAPIEIEHVVSP